MAVPLLLGALGGILKLSENPVIAYFLVLSVLLVDAGLIEGSLEGTGFKGLVGEMLSFILNALGLPIQVTSFQVLIIFAILPIFIFALMKSRQLQSK